MMRMTGLDAWPAVGARIRNMRARLAEFEKIHRRFGKSIGAWVERNFEMEGKLVEELPSGWPRLARGTLKARRGRSVGRMILQDSGRLRRSTRVQADSDRVVISNAVPYAARHQLGLGLPRRPFLPSAIQSRRIVDPVLAEFLEESIQ